MERNTESKLLEIKSKIKPWMHSNFLKIIWDKSDIISIGPKSFAKTANNFSLPPRTSPLNTTSTISQELPFFYLKNIAGLRPSLPVSAVKIFIHAFNTSRLDYCNIILYRSWSSPQQTTVQHTEFCCSRTPGAVTHSVTAPEPPCPSTYSFQRS